MISASHVSLVIPTRGDHDLGPVLESVAHFGEVLLYDNSDAYLHDLGAYGRYELIEYDVRYQVCATQDDDVTLTREQWDRLLAAYKPGRMISNMPENHNAGMPHLALPGWGSVFDRELPGLAFDRWAREKPGDWMSDDFLRVGCDIVFPVLTRHEKLDVGHHSLDYAYGDDRTHLRKDYPSLKMWYYREAVRCRRRSRGCGGR